MQSSLASAYTETTTKVYEGWIMFPSAWVNLKLHEPGPFYTLIGFGSITWHGMTMNKDSFEALPAAVRDFVVEVAKEFGEQTGSVNRAEYDRHIETLRGLITVKEIDPSVRIEWAQALAEWPASMARQLDAQGLPATEMLNLTLSKAEEAGHVWPVRFAID